MMSYRGYGQNQMHQWEMNQYKSAEKARKWRSKQKTAKLWTQSPKRTKGSGRRKRYTYGQPTTIRHRGRR